MTAAGWQAVILVGGFGTRLASLTAATPKPLLPVGDRPFLDHLLTWLAHQGAGEALLLAGHLGDQLAERYRSGGPGDLSVNCLIEPRPLGTGGALVYARDRLADRFVLCNGDSLFDLAPARLLAALGANDLAAIGLRALNDTGRSGVVDLVGDRVQRFAPRGDGGPGLINGGVYALRRAIVADLAVSPCSLESDLLPPLAAAGRVAGVIGDGFFLDIGVPDDYAKAQTVVAGFMRDHTRFGASVPEG